MGGAVDATGRDPSASSSSGRLGILYLPKTLDLRWKEAGVLSPLFKAEEEDAVTVESALVLTEPEPSATVFEAAVVVVVVVNSPPMECFFFMPIWRVEEEGCDAGRFLEEVGVAEEEEEWAAPVAFFLRTLPESSASWKMSSEEDFSVAAAAADVDGSFVFSGAMNR